MSENTLSGREIVEHIVKIGAVLPEEARALIIATVAKSPEHYAAVASWLGETEAGRHLVIAEAVKMATPAAGPPAVSAPKRPTDTETAPKTIPERAVAWLKANKGKHGPPAIRKGLGLPEGKPLGDLSKAGAQAEGGGPGRVYWWE